jgi:hypothetical protein
MIKIARTSNGITMIQRAQSIPPSMATPQPFHMENRHHRSPPRTIHYISPHPLASTPPRTYFEIQRKTKCRPNPTNAASIFLRAKLAQEARYRCQEKKSRTVNREKGEKNDGRIAYLGRISSQIKALGCPN